MRQSMNTAVLKDRIMRSIVEYCDNYFIGWGEHNNHHIKTLETDRVVVDYPKLKMRLYCSECNEAFTELWGIN